MVEASEKEKLVSQLPTEEQSRQLQDQARRSAWSMAEVIRRSVDLYLEHGPGPHAGTVTRLSAL